MRDQGDYRLFYPSVCLGKDKILALFRKGARNMGMSNPDEFMPHTLRHMLNNHITQDPNMSLKNCLSMMRHSSAAANLNYQANNMVSEENRLIALGFKPHLEIEDSKPSINNKNTAEDDASPLYLSSTTNSSHFTDHVFETPAAVLPINENRIVTDYYHS